MEALDVVLIAVILGGAIWLLYHSLWKRKGCCGSCNGNGCKGE